jgi:hypothetical protein
VEPLDEDDALLPRRRPLNDSRELNQDPW